MLASPQSRKAKSRRTTVRTGSSRPAFEFGRLIGCDAVTDALPLSPERLLEETRWLQSLAATLAGPQDSEDLAQMTWLRALEQEPGRIRGLRPWLRTVLHNALLRVRQVESAAARREAAVARRIETVSTADLAARASLHRTIVEAVLALDEPGRSTVLLRFFDGRPPREIARIQGVSVEAVRSRLRRALATLRTVLDRDVGERERWTVLVAPVGGGLLMSMKAKVAVATAFALLLLIAAGIAWRLTSPERAKQPSAPPDTTRLSREDRAHDRVVGTQSGAPSIAESASTRPLVAVAPAVAPIRARVHVSDDQGADVSGAAVLLTPLQSTERLASAMTDAHGDAALELPAARLATVHVAAEGFADTVMESVAFVEESRIQVDLVALGTLRIHVTDEGGVPIPDADVQVATEPAFGGVEPPEFRRENQSTDEKGTAVFNGVPQRRWYVRVHAKGFRDAPRGLKDWIVGPSDTTVVLERGVELVVHFEHAGTRAPAPGVRARIVSEHKAGSVWTQTVSDQNGVIAIGRHPEASSRITVEGDVTGEPSALFVPPGQTSATMAVSRPSAVACRVTREDGTLIDAAIYETANPRQSIPMMASEGVFLVDGQGVGTAPYFRFVVDGGATPWRRVLPWQPQCPWW